MIEYRKAIDTDVDALASLARDGLHAAEAFPLHIDMHKIRQTICSFVQMPGHFQLAAFDQGRPVAAIAMYVSEMPFFERAEGTVMMCYSIRPGAGMQLVREMMRFVAADIRIRRVMWSMNEGADRLSAMIARRFGFKHRHDNLVFYKGE